MSTPTILLGKRGAIEQPQKLSGGPLKFQTITRIWKGPKAAVKDMITQLQTAGYDWSYVENGPNATIEATFTGSLESLGGDPASEVPLDTWELLPGAVDKDVLEADKDAIESLSASNKRMIRQAIANPDSTPDGPSPAFTGPSATAALEIYLLMLSGLRAVKVFAPVLRRTRSVSNAYPTKQTSLNCGRIISTATLLGSGENSEGVPASFLITLSGEPYNNTEVRTNLKYGWFKNAAYLQQAAESRLQITQEWDFGLWPVGSTQLYGALL